MCSLKPPRHISTLPRLCENSDVELARRNFVSITLNRKRIALAVTVEGDKGENNSAHSLLAHAFTQPGSKTEVAALPSYVCFTPQSRQRRPRLRRPFRANNGRRCCL